MIFILSSSVSGKESISTNALFPWRRSNIDLFSALFIWQNIIHTHRFARNPNQINIFSIKFGSDTNPSIVAIYLLLICVLSLFWFSFFRSKINFVLFHSRFHYYRSLNIMFNVSSTPTTVHRRLQLLMWNQYWFRCCSPWNRLIVCLLLWPIQESLFLWFILCARWSHFHAIFLNVFCRINSYCSGCCFHW